MSRCSDLLHKAKQNPEGLRFVDLCKLAECHGWVFAREKGSHRLYTRPAAQRPMNFQEGENRIAKAYQVRQLLNWIEENSESN
jgi:hypothetical protein